ncbi:hypothetical protein [Aquimarina algicola]|uniref:Uncharacterized protein n=1 Tax=Aquimarina algicola TaxID=2589995 RepID=A0A504JHC5_9FLAO|nr:hypothetical protein [Aquimarina algicola]TPN87093.1 hypothetical protein FHK87_05745 [Aquimarina algicola]
MKNSEQDQERNKFISSIIESIKMNVNEFMDNLANGEKYETTIYKWSINLFNEGKSIDDAIKTVHKRRMLFVVNSTYNPSPHEEYSSQRNHQRIMVELESLPIYLNLNQSQKASIQNTIDALVESKLRTHSGIIELVTEIIKYNFETNSWKDKTSNKSRKKFDSDDNESSFLLKFKNYLNPKMRLNETLLPS